MIRYFLSIFAAAILAAGTANAQAVKSKITASNGVVVDLNADDFANRYEYSAPRIDISGSPSGFVFVAKIKRAGVLSDLTIQGSVFYGGNWHYYVTALYKGGEEANFTSTDRDVIGCHGGCSFSEGFIIKVSQKDVDKHAENGVLVIQLRARESSEIVMLEVPITYIDAVNEVAK